MDTHTDIDILKNYAIFHFYWVGNVSPTFTIIGFEEDIQPHLMDTPALVTAEEDICNLSNYPLIQNAFSAQGGIGPFEILVELPTCMGVYYIIYSPPPPIVFFLSMSNWDITWRLINRDLSMKSLGAFP
jgi:hypothetical protein